MKYIYCKRCSLFKEIRVNHTIKKNIKLVVLLDSPSNPHLNETDPNFKLILPYLKEHLREEDIDYIYALECYGIKSTNTDIDLCRQGLYTKLVLSETQTILALGETACTALNITGNLQQLKTKTLEIELNKKLFKVISSIAPQKIKHHSKITQNNITQNIQRAARVALTNVPLSEITKKYYKCIEPKQIEGFCKSLLKKTNNYISIDIQTNTPYSYHKHAKILSFSFGWRPHKICTFPFDHKDSTYQFKDVIRPIREFLSSDIPKIVHHSKKLQNFLVKYNIVVKNIIHDTMYSEHILNENHDHEYSLEDIFEYYAPLFSYHFKNHKTNLEKLQKFKTKKFYETQAPLPDITKYWQDMTMLRISANDAQELLDILTIKLKTASTIEKEDIKKLRTKVYGVLKRNEKKRNANKLKLELERLQQTNQLYSLEDAPLDILLMHNGICADVTRIIGVAQQKIFEEKCSAELNSLQKNIYLKSSPVLGQSEHFGLKIDKKYFLESHKTVEQQLIKITSKLHKEFGHNYNLNNQSDIAKILFNRLGLPIKQKVDNKYADTSQNVLKLYLQDDQIEQNKKEIVNSIIHMRKLNTFSYLLKNIKWFHDNVGRIYFNNNMCAAPTGRIYTSHMNIQGIPNYIYHHKNCQSYQQKPCDCNPINFRKIILADHDDHYLVTFDVAGIEIRVLTAYVPDQKLIKALNDGLDVHCWLTSEIFKLPYQDKESGMTEKFGNLRKSVKSILFGEFYGRGIYSLAKQLQITIKHAKEIKSKINNFIPKLENYKQNTRSHVLKNEYVKTHMGRYRRFDLDGLDEYDKETKIRQALNFPMQATAHDILLSQLHILQNNLEKYNGRFLFEVHDEFALTIPQKYIGIMDEMINTSICKNIKEQFEWLPVPFKLEIKYGENYGETKPIGELNGRSKS